ncbi:hypothetical protein LCGC14_1883080 [marine sediment metagenome]|uniref:Leucine-rich repeat domain-containing protein n=1 Tax=marine sediment metagenome TaxID=412755 RepID=A0A0F9G1K2_9ZZZZ
MNESRNTTEYRVNDLLSVRLEGDSVMIYIADKPFNTCKSIALNIPLDNVKKFDEIDSIDDITDNLVRYTGWYDRKYNISLETELFAHYSNLKTWYDNGYDTRLIHSNLAFPLLRKLAEEGDFQAKRAFKHEIALRLESGSSNVIRFLINEGYLKHLNDDEINALNWDSLYKSFTLLVKKVFEELERTDDEFEFDSRISLAVFFFSFLNKNNKLQNYLQMIYKGLNNETQCEILSFFCFVKINSQNSDEFLKIVQEHSSSIDIIVKNLAYVFENSYDFHSELTLNLVQSSVGIRIILNLLSVEIDNEYTYEIKESIADTLKKCNEDILKLEVVQFIQNFDFKEFKLMVRKDVENYAKEYNRSNNIEKETRERAHHKYCDLFYRILKHLPRKSLLETLLDHRLRIMENFFSLDNDEFYDYGFIEKLITKPVINFILKWIPPEEAEALSLIGYEFHLLNRGGIQTSPYIAVDETGHVTELCLGNCPLRMFPDALLKLTHLKRLVLMNTSIMFIPEEISQLKHLRQLDLAYNKIQFLPEGVCDLINLKHLSISDNPLRLLPECIGRLQALRHLDIFTTSVKNLPDSFLKLRLTDLHIPTHLCGRDRGELRKTTSSIQGKDVWRRYYL